MTSKYNPATINSRIKRSWLIKAVLCGLVLLAATVGIGIFQAQQWYQDALKPVSSSTEKVVVVVAEGSLANDISKLLAKKQLIKSTRAFDWYMRSRPDRDLIKAGTYEFSQSMSVVEIVDAIIEGRVAKNLFTILPGLRLDQIRRAFADAGYAQSAIDEAFNPAAHPRHPALVDKPQGATLEGYMYPESYQKTAETTPFDIISMALDEMSKQLTPDIRKAFAKHGLSVHEGITLASIVEREVSNDEDRAKVAQVFLKRLKMDMPLGSDVTFFYAAAITGQKASPDIDSPYNTRKYSGLPPGPISNVSRSSLQAVAQPEETDYLYFVSGDDGVTHFTSTLEEHEAATAKYCKKNCELPQ